MEEEEEEDDPSEARPGERKMTFKPPQLTEDEEFEVFLPKSMRCDGCQVQLLIAQMIGRDRVSYIVT